MQDKGGQAEAVDRHRNGNRRRIVDGCGTTLKQDRCQSEGDYHQGHGRGDCQGKGDFGGAADLGARSLFIPGLEAARQIGKQDHADGNAHHAKRQLVQAIGVVEPGHGPFVKAGHLTTDQQVDLHHTARQCGRGLR